MRVAVVGATGVLGRALVPCLLRDGLIVRALVRTPDRAARVLPAGTDITRFDLLSAPGADDLPKLLSGCDVVIHAATAIPSDFTVPGAWDRNTRLRTEGTRRLLDAALAAGVSRYIQQSIAFAYAGHGDEWITEEEPLDGALLPEVVLGPVRAMEEMVRAMPEERLVWSILRGGEFVGPDTLEAVTIENVRAGREPIVCGGRHFLPLVHVTDAAAAFTDAARHAPPGSVFNIVSEPIRQRDYLEGLAARLGAPHPPQVDAAPCPPSLRCSSRRARSLLGWAPRRGIWPM